MRAVYRFSCVFATMGYVTYLLFEFLCWLLFTFYYRDLTFSSRFRVDFVQFWLFMNFSVVFVFPPFVIGIFVLSPCFSADFWFSFEHGMRIDVGIWCCYAYALNHLNLELIQPCFFIPVINILEACFRCVISIIVGSERVKHHRIVEILFAVD